MNLYKTDHNVVTLHSNRSYRGNHRFVWVLSVSVEISKGCEDQLVINLGPICRCWVLSANFTQLNMQEVAEQLKKSYRVWWYKTQARKKCAHENKSNQGLWMCLAVETDSGLIVYPRFSPHYRTAFLQGSNSSWDSFLGVWGE